MQRFLAFGRFRLPLGKRVLLMGVLNVTPDSFSDGGRFLEPQKALEHALKMEGQGADLIDLGGESTRPGARPVSAREEIRRVIPVLGRLVKRLAIPVSVDTSKAVVAEAAIEVGASLINDVTALQDPAMAGVIAHGNVPVILMHMRGIPRTMQKNPSYRRLIPEVLSELSKAIAKARAAGISRESILVDPGLGFGKRFEDNLILLKGLGRLKKLGVPIVVGPSRKSFIGQILEAPVEDRLFGTASAVALSVFCGADMVRVHDVKQMRQVVLVAEAVKSARWNS